MKIVFLDLETTGLIPGRHQIWNIGYMAVDSDLPNERVIWGADLFIRDVDLSTADPMSLRIGHFYERHPQWKSINMEATGTVTAAQAARRLARDLDGAILAGNVINFDAGHLDKFMRANGSAPTWDHHLLEVESYCAAALGQTHPTKGLKLSEDLGVEPPTDEHTALGDAEWSYRMWLAAWKLSQKRMSQVVNLQRKLDAV